MNSKLGAQPEPDRTGAIRRRAAELGFDACRFTTAQPPESAAHFQRWLATGQHGQMAYLARNAHKRVDPQQVLPGARSIICLAVSYAWDEREPEAGQDADREWKTDDSRGSLSILHPRSSILVGPSLSHAGVIARYARYSDYHDVLAERLKQLTAYVNRLGAQGTRSLWYVDTGPLLERDLAQRAGVGFIGKHTNLISRGLGNWILLCEIITTLELEPDAPERNRCGSCSRCIAACPTGAITAAFQLDTRRCISYLTIELKGSIPVELRPAIGNRVFGCDDCLAVCPWNRFARQGRMMRTYARPGLAMPDLLGLLALDESAFRRRFAGTPMLRAGRRGLLRNVCVALGNVGDEAALPALEKANGDPEPLIAEHARWAAQRIRARIQQGT